MRAIALPLFLLLSACANGTVAWPVDQSEPVASAAPAAAPAPAPARPSAGRHASSSGGARGGATTAAARPTEDPDAPTPTGDPLTQARADCWMKTEKMKLRDVDARAAFVDKCVTDQMKNGPKS
jgi:hypothetical protein